MNKHGVLAMTAGGMKLKVGESEGGDQYGRVVIPVLLLAAWLLLVSLTAAGAITTSGQITGEETWSGRVRLTGDVTVTATGKLTILPGTQVECEPNSDDTKSGVDTLHIELAVTGGTLVAKGIADQRIVFTSAVADTMKKAGTWYGLRFIGASISTVVQYCTVQYGVNGISVERGALVNTEQWIVEGCSQNGASFVSSVILRACQEITVSVNGWGDGVVPLSVEGVGMDVDGGHLCL